MITEDKKDKLIEIYYYICEKFKNDLQIYCQRFSNNSNPQLTDQEIMSIYIFAVSQEQKFK